jgi:hypothetical protein
MEVNHEEVASPGSFVVELYVEALELKVGP